jgi:hypothetical protein
LLEGGIARHVEDFVVVDVDLLLEGAHLYNLYSKYATSEHISHSDAVSVVCCARLRLF